MKDYKKSALMFKALCDENRLRILEILSTGEKCACTLLEKLPVAQSTLSHHMKILIDSGVVTSRKEGKWTYYALDQGGSDHIKNSLENLLTLSPNYPRNIKCD